MPEVGSRGRNNPSQTPPGGSEGQSFGIARSMRNLFCITRFQRFGAGIVIELRLDSVSASADDSDRDLGRYHRTGFGWCIDLDFGRDRRGPRKLILSEALTFCPPRLAPWSGGSTWPAW
ncbi:hypothetical protein BN13_420058 [Nostocoides jenkinsii Ben 74]|uniref:Uncharacterized protein n=1 Tax=Nostocoides jenkinsii Ben 74 TaxID=1193518 RepID=A0A077MAE3_9MICO|nr:hypothetical protein BN13_420058 [Tetrasphaera jenkinsii Ben 74]